MPGRVSVKSELLESESSRKDSGMGSLEPDFLVLEKGSDPISG